MLLPRLPDSLGSSLCSAHLFPGDSTDSSGLGWRVGLKKKADTPVDKLFKKSHGAES